MHGAPVSGGITDVKKAECGRPRRVPRPGVPARKLGPGAVVTFRWRPLGQRPEILSGYRKRPGTKLRRFRRCRQRRRDNAWLSWPARGQSRRRCRRTALPCRSAPGTMRAKSLARSWAAIHSRINMNLREKPRIPTAPRAAPWRRAIGAPSSSAARTHRRDPSPPSRKCARARTRADPSLGAPLTQTSIGRPRRPFAHTEHGWSTPAGSLRLITVLFSVDLGNGYTRATDSARCGGSARARHQFWALDPGRPRDRAGRRSEGDRARARKERVEAGNRRRNADRLKPPCSSGGVATAGLLRGRGHFLDPGRGSRPWRRHRFRRVGHCRGHGGAA